MIIQPLKNSLEVEFEQFALPYHVDTYANCTFHDFYEPNEYFPECVKPHLQWSQKGLLVSTGSERSFFDLMYSDETLCEGLVVVDINPRIKAYVDFNILLLRILQTRDEYLQYSTATGEGWHLEHRLSLIHQKLEGSDLPQKIKNYYTKNLQCFGSVYLTASQYWRGKKAEYFEKCRYDLDDDYFLKLQRYARAGNIIATEANINDLRFLKNRDISIVDTSNIRDYTFVNLKGPENFRPRVIWTIITYDTNKYRSYIHEELRPQEKREIHSCIKKMKDESFNDGEIALFFNERIAGYNDNCDNEQFDASSGAIFSKKTLKRMREFVEEVNENTKKFKFED